MHGTIYGPRIAGCPEGTRIACADGRSNGAGDVRCVSVTGGESTLYQDGVRFAAPTPHQIVERVTGHAATVWSRTPYGPIRMSAPTASRQRQPVSVVTIGPIGIRRTIARERNRWVIVGPYSGHSVDSWRGPKDACMIRYSNGRTSDGYFPYCNSVPIFGLW